jgi:electron transfer flavoprotein beta subunit
LRASNETLSVSNGGTVKILVPVKRVADPDNANKVKVSGDATAISTEGLEWKPNPFDEYAVEAALRLNENAPKNEKLGETIVVSIGPSEVQQTLRQALAMGADRGVLIDANDGVLDTAVTARAFKALVDAEKPDLVLMGKQTVDGDSNAVGQTLAELLGWPMATFAMGISTTDGGKTLTVGREVDTGVLTLKVTLPAVVTVDLRIVAPNAVKNGVTPADHKYYEGHGSRRRCERQHEVHEVRAAARAFGQRHVRRVGRRAPPKASQREKGHLTALPLVGR